MRNGHLSLETMILTVEPGRGYLSLVTNQGEGGGGGGGEGGHLSFVSRNNDSNCRTREKG